MLTDGALALAPGLGDADPASADPFLRPKNRVNGLDVFSPARLRVIDGGLADGVRDFGLSVRKTASAKTDDQIGSTRLITDAAGATATASTFTFDPYGNTLSSTGSLTTHLMFNAEYLDVESGWYYLRARYYEPGTGQFVTLDPLVTTTRSPYAYVAGNPLNGTDPTGLFRLDNEFGHALGDASCTGDPLTDAEKNSGPGFVVGCEGNYARDQAERNAQQQWDACNSHYDACDNAVKAAVAACGYIPGPQKTLCTWGSRAAKWPHDAAQAWPKVVSACQSVGSWLQRVADAGANAITHGVNGGTGIDDPNVDLGTLFGNPMGGPG